jgi:hypothetical protein
MKSLILCDVVGRGWTMRLGLAAVLGLGLGLAGCSPSYVTSNSSPVNLIIAAINGGAPLDSDVRDGSNTTTGTNGTPTLFICADFVKVDVAVRNKNPNGPVPTVPSAVLLSSYEVRYTRSDGRGVEGIDVPYRITGNLSFSIDVATSGTSSVAIEVVRRQAKLEPPLSTIFQTGVLTTNAQVTLYGTTVSGQAVSATATFQIDFADFGDTNTTCPTTS